MSTQERWDDPETGDQELERLIRSSLNVEPSASFLSRVRDAVAETTVDQEIQNTLNVEPSPEFIARVRQRVEHDGPYVESAFGRIFKWRWTLASGVLAAAAAVSIAVLINRPSPNDVAPVTPSIASAPPVAPPFESLLSQTSAPTLAPQETAAPTRTAARAVVASAETRSDPEVIVSREEVRAFREYWTHLAPEAFKTTAAVERQPGATPLPAVEQLAIEPIVVAPIDPSTE